MEGAAQRCPDSSKFWFFLVLSVCCWSAALCFLCFCAVKVFIEGERSAYLSVPHASLASILFPVGKHGVKTKLSFIYCFMKQRFLWLWNYLQLCFCLVNHCSSIISLNPLYCCETHLKLNVQR